jgi:hypothetical protein
MIVLLEYNRRLQAVLMDSVRRIYVHATDHPFLNPQLKRWETSSTLGTIGFPPAAHVQ